MGHKIPPAQRGQVTEESFEHIKQVVLNRFWHLALLQQKKKKKLQRCSTIGHNMNCEYCVAAPAVSHITVRCIIKYDILKCKVSKHITALQVNDPKIRLSLSFTYLKIRYVIKLAEYFLKSMKYVLLPLETYILESKVYF